MCGASNSEKQIAGQQSEFYTNMTNQAKEVFGNSSTVFNDLVSAFAPIVAAGPNQEGFSQGELAALNSQATEGTAQTYNKAAGALAAQQAARGGGNAYIPSGAAEQEREQLVSSAAANESAQKLNIARENYATGRNNFMAASSVLGGAPSVFNATTGINNSTIGAGDAAFNSAKTIADQDQSWKNAVFGALGGLAKTAVGAIPGVGPFLSAGMTAVGKAGSAAINSSQEYVNNPENLINPNEGIG